MSETPENTTQTADSDVEVLNELLDNGSGEASVNPESSEPTSEPPVGDVKEEVSDTPPKKKRGRQPGTKYPRKNKSSQGEDQSTDTASPATAEGQPKRRGRPPKQHPEGDNMAKGKRGRKPGKRGPKPATKAAKAGGVKTKGIARSIKAAMKALDAGVKKLNVALKNLSK